MRVEQAEVLQMSLVSILIVDDFEPWRHFVVSSLQKVAGVRVVGVACDGMDAVQKARELQPDLILLDLCLPRLSGLEVAQRIAEIAPGCKILFVSDTSDADVVRGSFHAGGSGYVLKSDAARDLVTGIDAVLLGTRFVSRGLARCCDLTDAED
jgi:two-component system, NarL family, nitrate/nitrite response regulator NarL